MKNKLIEKFGSESRWVNWKMIRKNGDLTKVPFSAHTGGMAASTKPETWSTYDHVKSKSDKIGIIFKPDQLLLGVDIDDCINKENQIVIEEAKLFFQESQTYCELSPSGNGLHFFFELSEPFDPIANKKKPFEVYTSGRYFTFTGKIFGESRDIRKVDKEYMNKILPILGYPWTKEEVTTPIQTPSILTNLSDSDLLDKMFNSKNGDKIKALYDGDTSNHNKDESSADMALLAHLAFYTQRDASQMERIWLSSPLAGRKKTQNRKDYRDRSIANAIAKCAKVYTPPSKTSAKAILEAGEIDFITMVKFTKDGEVEIIIQNTENICRVLRNHPSFRGILRYDIFRNTLEIRHNNVWRIMEDNDSVNVQTQISILYMPFVKVGKDMVYDAMIKVAKENMFDSARDFIESLTWDKTPRLNQWLSHTYGAPDDIYHQAVGANWIKGMVKRIVEPGCKFDYVLVLEGEQGTRKSTSLAVLGGQWHIETTMSTDSKDFFMQFQGKSIIEFSEGETLSRTEVKRMKAIITMQTDKYRPPYERVSQDFPRRCVFAMTTNETEYLKDETGNRRWLPVKLIYPNADIDWLSKNRNQLLAEAYYRLTTLHESVHEFPIAETLQAQAERRVINPNVEKIMDWYMTSLSDSQREEGITVTQVYDNVMNKGGAPRALDKYNEMIIATILKESLRLEKKRVMRNRVQLTRWFNVGLFLKPVDEMQIMADEANKQLDA